jgi:Uma2 family endonuclease
MSTTLNKPIPSNNLLIIYDVTWTQLEAIEASFQDIGGVRFTYLDGVLEIMNVSLEHEESKTTLALLLEAYMRAKGVRFYGRGSATLGSKEIGGKKEPDESYNIHSKKPIPDLVIEVIVSSGGINKLELYQRIGIPEVWFWEDGVLKIYHLQENYQLVEKSNLLPDLDLKIFSKYINYHDQYDAVTEFLKYLSIK